MLQERNRNTGLQSMVADLQNQLRLKVKHENSLAKGDYFALQQDENRLTAQSLAYPVSYSCYFSD